MPWPRTCVRMRSHDLSLILVGHYQAPLVNFRESLSSWCQETTTAPIICGYEVKEDPSQFLAPRYQGYRSRHTSPDLLLYGTATCQRKVRKGEKKKLCR